MTCKDTKLSSRMSVFCHPSVPPQFRFTESYADWIHSAILPFSLNTHAPVPMQCLTGGWLDWRGHIVTVPHFLHMAKLIMAEWKVRLSLISIHWVTSWPPLLSPPALHPLTKFMPTHALTFNKLLYDCMTTAQIQTADRVVTGWWRNWSIKQLKSQLFPSGVG